MNRFSAHTALLLSVLLAPMPVAAADYVWLIGGGYDLDSSQAQIEQNVLWVSRLLKQIPGARTQRIYFDDGDNPAPDVKAQLPLRGDDGLEPLRRLFAHGHVAGYRYRNHVLPQVDGGTEHAQLLAKLEQEIAALRPNDRLLIVFNGHGTRSRRDVLGNRLWLWNGTSLDVRGFDTLLARVPSTVPVRFVFTQCYAGAFARLATDGRKNRCGFLAESEDQPAEGCSAGVDADDYRDYTTYFFAALSGRTRLDEPLPFDPDLDGDGRVSLHEAHLYALRAGESADLPRATSEVFLERWQPWYADWRGLFGRNGDALPENIYAKLADAQTAVLGLPLEDRALRRELKQRRARELLQARALQRRQRRQLQHIGAIQREIHRVVERRWPQLPSPVNVPADAAAHSELNDIAGFIRAHARYAELVLAQDRYAANEDALLALERRQTQFDKVLRLRKLARLQGRFQAEASVADREGYQRLLSCEQQGL